MTAYIKEFLGLPLTSEEEHLKNVFVAAGREK
jgi:hypothetical protein